MTKIATVPTLSDEERVLYDRIQRRLARAHCDARRAKKRSDSLLAASAERARTRAESDLSNLISPKVGHLWAPTRITARFDHHWSGPSGRGVHHFETEMVLERKDLSGPCYRTVRVLKDEGGPPSDARSAPDSMGIAWAFLDDSVRRGRITVLEVGK